MVRFYLWQVVQSLVLSPPLNGTPLHYITPSDPECLHTFEATYKGDKTMVMWDLQILFDIYYFSYPKKAHSFADQVCFCLWPKCCIVHKRLFQNCNRRQPSIFVCQMSYQQSLFSRRKTKAFLLTLLYSKAFVVCKALKSLQNQNCKLIFVFVLDSNSIQTDDNNYFRTCATILCIEY